LFGAETATQGLKIPAVVHPAWPGVQEAVPPLITLAEPKKKLPEIPVKMVDVDAVGTKVMLVGDADKSDPVKVADVPDKPDNDHDTRLADVTLHASQLSTMSPVTVTPLNV
jgi:hypothetical protein